MEGGGLLEDARGRGEVEGIEPPGIQSFVPTPGFVDGDSLFVLRSCDELTPWRLAMAETVSPLRTV